MSAPRAFTDDERLAGHLSPCGLGLAVDRRARREASAEGRPEPEPLFLRPEHLRRLDLAIRDGLGGRLDSTTTPGVRPLGAIVQMPPRHGKSMTTSRYTPAWFLGLHPRKRVILASYEAGIAAEFGRQARDLLEDVGEPMFGVRVRQDTRSVSNWQVSGGGGMQAAGIRGAITGKGADLLVIDDPVKNAEEALSPVLRERNWEWWQTTARTRLHPGAFVLVVLTRWHEDDLAGRLLKAAREDPDADQWHELVLPAIAEADDPLGREPGEALWAARYDAEYLERTRRSAGAYWFGALYQQRPAPGDGGIFDRRDVRRYEVVEWRPLDAAVEPGSASFAAGGRVPSVVRLRGEDGELSEPVGLDHQRVFQTVDLAAGEKQTSDFTVILTIAATVSGDLLVLDVERRRIAGPDQPELIAQVYGAWQPESIHVEQIGYQTALIQALTRTGLPVLALRPDKDKVSRAASAAARYRTHHVFHPTSAPWLQDFETELLAFPVGQHDDQVDALAYAAKVAMNLPGQVGGEVFIPRQSAAPIGAGVDPRRL